MGQHEGFRFAPVNEKEFAELDPAVLDSLALEVSPLEYLKAIGPALVDKATDHSTEIYEHNTATNSR